MAQEPPELTLNNLFETDAGKEYSESDKSYIEDYCVRECNNLVKSYYNEDPIFFRRVVFLGMTVSELLLIALAISSFFFFNKLKELKNSDVKEFDRNKKKNLELKIKIEELEEIVRKISNRELMNYLFYHILDQNLDAQGINNLKHSLANNGWAKDEIDKIVDLILKNN